MSIQHHLLVYDDHCPLCDWYSALFVKYKLLAPGSRQPFSHLSPELISLIDLDKSRNEIPLINTATGHVRYGIDALLTIFGQRFPLIEKLGRLSPINFLLRKLYKFISFNRKVIVAKRCGPGEIDCTPGMNYFYRLLFMLLFLVFNTVMLWPIHDTILIHLDGITVSSNAVITAHFVLIGINCLAATGLSKNTAIEYLGQANMLALLTILLLLPLLLFIKLFGVVDVLLPLYLGITALVIFREYLRRMEYAGILPARKWTASLNLVCMAGYVLFMFS